MPICYGRCRACPTLAYDIEVRVFVHDGFYPFASWHHLYIWIGVHAQAVEVGVFDPPDSPLLEVLQQVGVLEVHIGHWAVEPTAVGEQTVVLRCVDVVVSRENVVGVGKCVELAKMFNVIYHTADGGKANVYSVSNDGTTLEVQSSSKGIRLVYSTPFYKK